MLKWLSAQNLAQTYRDPVSWAVLAVDLFPIYALFSFGWDAGSLVFLYWLENLVIGAMTLLRMTATSVRHGALGGAVMLFLGPFFTLHYGMFCFVHGVFLMVFASISQGGDPPFPTPIGLIDYALGTGQHMLIFIGAIIALQLFLFVRDFMLRGAWRETEVMEEMTKPYARIVVLHISIFVGFGLLLLAGQPFIGVLGLILLRALWGVYQSVRRRLDLDESAVEKVDEASPI